MTKPRVLLCMHRADEWLVTRHGGDIAAFRASVEEQRKDITDLLIQKVGRAGFLTCHPTCFKQPRGKPEGPKHCEFPEVSRETRGCFGAPFLLHSPFWQLSSFPESESWFAFGAKSEAKPREPANSAGVFSRYIRGVPGIPAKYPGILPIWLIWGPNQPQTRLRAREIDDFHGVSPLEGALGKLAGNTERKPGRVREETLGQAKRERTCEVPQPNHDGLSWLRPGPRMCGGSWENVVNGSFIS